VRRDLERRVVPADRLARRRDLLLAERRTVRIVAAGLVRRALADDRLAADEARPVTDLAATIAASTAATSWPSTLGTTCQP